MAKQRFVVYKAFDKQGREIDNLLVAGGKCMPFSATNFTMELGLVTSQVMGYGGLPSVAYWKDCAKSRGACRFQKVIYFN